MNEPARRRAGANIGAAVQAGLPLDDQAPRAARGVITRCLSGRVDGATLQNARLLVSELVTNSVRHSGASAPAVVVVRVTLDSHLVGIEVDDPGRDRVIAARPPDPSDIGGHGLRLVQALSRSWGLERLAAGGTRVWVQLAWPAASAQCRPAVT